MNQEKVLRGSGRLAALEATVLWCWMHLAGDMSHWRWIARERLNELQFRSLWKLAENEAEKIESETRGEVETQTGTASTRHATSQSNPPAV